MGWNVAALGKRQLTAHYHQLHFARIVFETFVECMRCSRGIAECILDASDHDPALNDLGVKSYDFFEGRDSIPEITSGEPDPAQHHLRFGEVRFCHQA